MIESIKKAIWRPLFNYVNGFRRAKNVSVPYSLKRQTMLDYKSQNGAEIFVETGTYLGDTTDMLKTHFQQLYSIELAEELAKNAQERFKNEPNITIIQGDSGEKLAEIMPKLSSPALFWLDGHYSGEFVHDSKMIKTAKADVNTPILKELATILKEGIGRNIILIDDARLFNGKNDYPTIADLTSYLKRYKIDSSQVSVKDDIIRIIPST